MEQSLDFDLRMMRKAIALAKRGIGFTSPNPIVGALVVCDGEIVGRGWHRQCGGPHAEVNAVADVKDTSLLSRSTLYVTLEPCCTTGRTPPCCDLILRSGIRRVVVGCPDPNPKHAGRGIELLRNAGIEVTVGVAEEACRRMNAPFMKWIVEKKPYVLLKMAETLDGKIATRDGCSRWITGEPARRRVAMLRLMSDAVLAGGETWRIDKPRFTARDADGTVLKRPKLYAATHEPEVIGRDDVTCVALDTKDDWQKFLAELGGQQITMLLIEGGGELAASALRAGAVDEIEFHIAPKLLGGRGSRSVIAGQNPISLDESIDIESMRMRRCGNDWIVNGFPHKQVK